MRYNLTIDDNIARLIEEEAGKLSIGAVKITAIDLIRKAVEEKYVTGLPIDRDKLKILTPRHLRGYVVKADKRAFFLIGEESPLGAITLKNVIEIPQPLIDLIGTVSNHTIQYFPKIGSGMFTAIRLQGEDEYLICQMPDGVTGDMPTTDTLKAKKRASFILNGKAISDFFSL